VTVPLATYTGWALRAGTWANDGCEGSGQMIPFAKTRAEREVNRNTLIVIAGRAYDSLQGSLRELAVLRETAIPKATEASEAISQGYGQGRFTLLEVLDAQASVSQARLREQEALQNFHAGVATIEGLVGNPFTLARETAR
jgi:cobalt-zinc-cadmium efflux system outer membrane protein